MCQVHDGLRVFVHAAPSSQRAVPPVLLHQGGSILYRSKSQLKYHLLRKAVWDLPGQNSTPKALSVTWPFAVFPGLSTV